MPSKIKRLENNEKYDLLNYFVLNSVVNSDNCYSNLFHHNIFLFISAKIKNGNNNYSMRIRETYSDKLKTITLKEGLKKWMSNFKTKDLRIIMHNVDDYFIAQYDRYKNKNLPLDFCGFFAYEKDFIKNKININNIYLFSYEFLFCTIL